ncbi:tetratricopeptide repeat protein [Acidobacteria bacterium AH-259-D05]|nr:tetratricopeptide repeat protein [Acidobacteria bacterium AH-259-D05]
MKAFHHRIPLKIVLILGLCISLTTVAGLGRDTYEFRGRVLQPDGKTFRESLALVFLQGATTPFTTRQLADVSGRFKFKNLRPGMYTLIIAVPLWGEMRRTIEVGPSFADSKGRIEGTFYLEEKYSREDEYTISATQLSVPDRAKREYRRAEERLEKHDISQAVKHLEKAVDLAPQFAAAWNHLGTIAYHSREYKQAEEYFRESLKQDPHFYPPLVNLGGALLSQGRAEESFPYNLRAVQARPDDALAHSQLGQSYLLLSQLEEAERHLKQAKALDPKHFSLPQLMLAEIYQLLQNDWALISELEEFLEYHPDSDRVPEINDWVKRARARVGEGRN